MSTTTNTIVIAQQKVDLEASYRALIDGLNTLYPKVTEFDLNGQTFQRADLLGKFQNRVDSSEKTKSMRSDLKAQVKGEKAVDKEVRPLRSAVKRWVEAREGVDSPKLQKLGFPERKQGKTKPAVKARAVVKAEETKQARGILGRKQRAKIHAPPPAPVASPPPAPAPETAPAASPVKS